MLHRLTVLAAALGTLAASTGGALAASPVGGRCGGFVGLRCNPGLTCRITAPGADRMGVCVRAGSPRFCPQIYQPVCGRDGRTYGNECELRGSGAGLAHLGRC